MLLVSSSIVLYIVAIFIPVRIDSFIRRVASLRDWFDSIRFVRFIVVQYSSCGVYLKARPLSPSNKLKHRTSHVWHYNTVLNYARVGKTEREWINEWRIINHHLNQSILRQSMRLCARLRYFFNREAILQRISLGLLAPGGNNFPLNAPIYSFSTELSCCALFTS